MQILFRAVNLRFCISIKLPGEADAVGPLAPGPHVSSKEPESHQPAQNEPRALQISEWLLHAQNLGNPDLMGGMS